MKDLSPFCTCIDRACPAHHEKGCAPCIQAV